MPESLPSSARRTLSALTVCAVAYLLLVVAVALQAPAISTGVRWVPGPRSRTLDLIEIAPLDGIAFAFGARSADGWPIWMRWALVIITAVALLVALRRWLRWSRTAPRRGVVRLDVDTSAAGEADARVLTTGLAAAIAVLQDTREPSDAVVKAWQGLQDAAASAGLVRHPAETPSEFTARILHRSRESTAPIAVLLSLYQRVRFGEHVPTPLEIVDAQRALAALVAVWRADLRDRRPARAERA